MMAALPMAVAADIRVVEEIAAKVNGDIVTRGEMEEQRRELEMFLRQQQHMTGVELATAVQEESKNFLRDKIDQLLMVQKAKDLNISVEGDVARRLAEMQVVAKITDPEKFHDYVRDNSGVPFEEFKQGMTNKFLQQHLIGQEIGGRIAIPEPELRKYYDAHAAEYVRKAATVFLSQILISTEGKTPEQAAAAETKAKDVAARARKGEKFSDLVAAYSDDKETAGAGGQLPPREKGVSLQPIEDFAFKEKKGSVSDPIKIATGFVILRIDERYEAGPASFDEVRDQIQEALAAPQIETKVRAYLTRLRQDAFLEVKDGYVDTGAAPGKDTHWHDIAQLKPQTTTKEEVAATHRRHKHFLFVPIPGTTATKGTTPNIDTSKLGERKAAASGATPDTPATPDAPTAPAAPATPATPATPAPPATPDAPATAPAKP
jgi:parvulin-like peptidyl-prolyl isomerase